MKAQLTDLEFNTLLRHTHAIELQKVAVNALIARRDAYYAAVAAAHDLPPTFKQMSWNDETLEIDVT